MAGRLLLDSGDAEARAEDVVDLGEGDAAAAEEDHGVVKEIGHLGYDTPGILVVLERGAQLPSLLAHLGAQELSLIHI